MEKIRNYKTYTDGMAKTFADKAWFVEKLPPHIDTLIDFGCADGACGSLTLCYLGATPEVATARAAARSQFIYNLPIDKNLIL